MNVQQRFLAVQQGLAAHGIAKSGVNQQQRYNYRGIEQVQNALAPLLVEHGLIIMPNTISHTMVPGQTKSGGASYHHTVEVEYTIMGPEGDCIGPYRARGECIDYGDKGLNKAHSAAYKYWILTAMCVPTEATEDADATTPEAEVPRETINAEQFGILNEMVMLLDDDTTGKFTNWVRAAGCNDLRTLEARHYETVKSQLERLYAEQYHNEQAATAKSMGDA